MRRDLTWRLVEWWLVRRLPPPALDAVLGDLQDDYERRRAGTNGVAARVWLLREAGSLQRAYGEWDEARIRRHGGARGPAAFVSQALAGWRHDLGHAVRGLYRSPGFTLLTLTILTFSIGLCTTFFSLANGLLLRPWPLPDPDDVVFVAPARALIRDWSAGTQAVSATEFRYLRDHATTVDLVASRGAYAQLGVGPGGQRIRVGHVSGNYFDVLRMPLALGRGFRADEDVIGRPTAVALISHAMWIATYGGADDVIGRTVHLNDQPFTIVGVVGSGRTDPSVQPPDLWVPMATIPLLDSSAFSQRVLVDPEYCCVGIAGRLRERATHAEATAELTTLDAQFSPPIDPARRAGIVVTGTAVKDQPGTHRLVAIIALVMSGLGLLVVVASVNVGILQLARMLGRRSELAIRQALGAGRWRLVRQLLADGFVLTSLAAGLGLAGAYLVAASGSGMLDRERVDVRPDLTVFLFATFIVGCTVAMANLAPSLRATRGLSAHSRMSSTGRLRPHAWLLAAQVAVSAVLIASAALLSRSAIHVATFDVGFAVDDVLVARVLSSQPGDTTSRLDDVRDAIRTAFVASDDPALAEVSIPPLAGSRMTTGVRLPGAPETEAFKAYTLDVTSSFFDVLGIQLVDGRVFGLADGQAAVVINQALARRLFAGAPAVGRTVLSGDERHVVGVVADAHLSSLDRVEPTLFRSLDAGASLMSSWVVRNDPAVVERLRAAVAGAQAGARLSVRPLRDNISTRLQPYVIGASIAGALGLLALVLAGIGVFGVFSYAVHDRTREVGIRMALGATRRHVIHLVLAQAGWPLLSGLVAGLVASVIAAPVLRSYLLGIGPHDALAFLSVIAVLAAAAFVAVIVPARRATAVDPSVALRVE